MEAQSFPIRRMFTIDEYLALERNADYKSEFVDGEIYVMSGGSPNHSLIAANVIRELGNRLAGSACNVYTSDLKVGIRLEPVQTRSYLFRAESERGLYGYPDATVVCGEMEFHDDHHDVVTNPALVVEVLSPSTEIMDRERKLPLYRRFASLNDILFVAQDAGFIEHHHRTRPSVPKGPDSEGDWEVTVVSGLDSSLVLPSLAIVLLPAQIYRNVRFRELP